MILDLKKHSVPNMRKHLRIAMIGVSLVQWPCRTDWTPSIFLSVLGVKVQHVRSVNVVSFRRLARSSLQDHHSKLSYNAHSLGLEELCNCDI